MVNKGFGGSTNQGPGIPRQNPARWPEGQMPATPPPPPRKPVLSLAYPLIPKATGKASVA